jgi:hypothetical protein
MHIQHYETSCFKRIFSRNQRRCIRMKRNETELLNSMARAALKEHLDAFVLVGYTADTHKRVIVTDFGKDPSCGDGLQIMAVAAERWREGVLNRPTGSDGPIGFVKD